MSNPIDPAAVLNVAGVISENQLREAFGITRTGWAKFKKRHGLVRPKLGKTCYYTAKEVHDFIAGINSGDFPQST